MIRIDKQTPNFYLSNVNPDLVERLKKDEPLSQDLKMDLFYMADEKGYTDYPVFGA